MNKEKIKGSIKTLGKSIYNNKALIERRNYSFLAPIIIFILTIFLTCVPSFLVSKNMKTSTIMDKFPSVGTAIEELLTSELDCKVENATLVCSETAEKLNITATDTNTKITYTVIANNSAITLPNVAYENPPLDTDNFIVLLNKYIKFRYIERDHVNHKIKKYELIGDYTDLEGYNFKEISQTLLNSPDQKTSEIENFVHKTYTSTLDTKFLVNLSSISISFLLLVLVTTLLLKSPYIFKFKKGFKYSECLKISLSSSLSALIFGFLISLVGFDFTTAFGFVFVARIIFIYFKYIFLNKNNIYKTLYAETKEERFNV